MNEEYLDNLIESFLTEALSSSMSTADLMKAHGLKSFYSSVPTGTLMKAAGIETPKLKNTPDRMMMGLARDIGAHPPTAATRFSGAKLGHGLDDLATEHTFAKKVGVHSAGQMTKAVDDDNVDVPAYLRRGPMTKEKSDLMQDKSVQANVFHGVIQGKLDKAAVANAEMSAKFHAQTTPKRQGFIQKALSLFRK